MDSEQIKRLKMYLKFLSDTRGVALDERKFISEIERLSHFTDPGNLEDEYKAYYRVFAKEYMHKIYHKVFSTSGDQVVLSKEEETNQVSKRIGTVNTMITAIMNSDIFTAKLPLDKIIFGGLSTDEFIQATRFDAQSISRAQSYLSDMQKKGLSSPEDIRNNLEDNLFSGASRIRKSRELQENHEKKMEASSILMTNIAPAYRVIYDMQRNMNPVARALTKDGKENSRVLAETLKKLSALTGLPVKTIKENLFAKSDKDSYSDKTISYEQILLKNQLIDEFKKQAAESPNILLSSALAFDKNAEKHYSGEYYLDDVEFATEALAIRDESGHSALEELSTVDAYEDTSKDDGMDEIGETYVEPIVSNRSPRITFNRVDVKK